MIDRRHDARVLPKSHGPGEHQNWKIIVRASIAGEDYALFGLSGLSNDTTRIALRKRD